MSDSTSSHRSVLPPLDRPNAFPRVQVRTGARLHFGLLDIKDPFGGVGVMVEHPTTHVLVTPSNQFQCDHALEARLKPIATRVMQISKATTLPACRIEVLESPSPHSGLGSGTQLSLAVAEAICRFVGIQLTPDALAVDVAGRGKRSAIGVHGYFHGGLLFEDATDTSELNPIQQREELPSHWSVVVVGPKQAPPVVYGENESEQFASLPKAPQASLDSLRRILTDEVLPAAGQGNFDWFASSVGEYNRASGMLFAEIQGGPYHGDSIQRLIGELKSMGLSGVGQSSWGPAIFVWFESHEKSTDFVNNMPSGAELIAQTHPLHRSRTVQHLRG